MFSSVVERQWILSFQKWNLAYTITKINRKSTENETLSKFTWDINLENEFYNKIFLDLPFYTDTECKQTSEKRVCGGHGMTS